MSQPRYQVFVSSTFRDLKEEREAVLHAILKLNQFPAGMELFPATNDTAWKHIEKVIQDSDYYVLVIGGKYGSIDESGISYTEKEYDFAVSQNIPVLAFIRSDEENIPAGKVELDSEVREKLKSFKEKVGLQHHLNYWQSVDELKANVLSSLSMAFVMNPQTGWVKAGRIDNTELLTRLADLQQRYDNLVEENNKIKDSALFFDTDKFLKGDDFLSIKYELNDAVNEISLTFNEILLGIGEKLIIQCEIDHVETELGIFIWEIVKNSEIFDISFHKGRFRIVIEKESLLKLEVQLLVLELIDVSSIIKQYSGGNNLVRDFRGQNQTYIEKTWQLTDKGRKLYLTQKALRQ